MKSVKGEKERLIDDYGREIRSLRFSITNRCNLNCIYCHNEGEERRERREEISAELVIGIARVASAYFDIRKIKFSGGEPLMRDDLVDIIQGMRDFEDDISATTNGILLSKYAAELADAGLDRVNVSLDSLKEERYDFITSSCNNLPKVIEGIYSAIDAGLTPLKLNMVLLKGINEEEIEGMMDFVRECNKRGRGEVAILQLIELIPCFNHKPLQGLQVSPSGYEADFCGVEAELKSKASAIKTRRLQHRRKYFVDGVEVEVVHPIDNTEFCANCSRLRITFEGKIKPCLLRNDHLVPIKSVDEMHIINKLKLAMKYREPFYKEGKNSKLRTK
ncbi:MAG: GTP 3',8-cyclase MoaA [Methanophagales archaeon]|nr:GTP 3',8-cyclase MoaA [Methanophagales archaeon]MCW3141677.1 GTP 3',8-cyclase MoaA [Methanophagales archaeon]